MKFIRSDHTWRIVGAFSGESGCLEWLAFNKGYRVGDICAALGCSQRHLYGVFVRDIGLPPKKWMDLERMVVARRKLEGGEVLSKVAEDMGYTSVVAFSRRFERTYGVPPGRYVKCRRVFDPSQMQADDHPSSN